MRLPFTQRGACLAATDREAYLRRALPPDDLDLAEKHLASCPECLRATLAIQEEARLRRLGDRLKSLPAAASARASAESSVPAAPAPAEPRKESDTRRITRRNLPAVSTPPLTRRTRMHLVRRDGERETVTRFAAVAAAILVGILALIFLAPSNRSAETNVAGRNGTTRRTPEPIRHVAVPPTRTPGLVEGPVPGPAPEPAPPARPKPASAGEGPSPVEGPAPREPEAPRAIARAPSPAVTPELPATPPVAFPVTPPRAPETQVAAETPAPTPTAPAAPAPVDTTAVTLRLEEVQGDLWINDRIARPGDAVGAGDVLRTPPGALASIVAANATLRIDEDTALKLAGGPRVTLDAGRIFVKSAPGLRVATAAGTLTPIGTEFTVEIAGRETSVAMREGTVRFEGPQGRAEVTRGFVLRCAEGKAPRPPARIADPEAAFGWADAIAGGKYLRTLAVAKRPGGVVISAPHAPHELMTHVLAGGLARRLGAGCVIGYGLIADGLCRIVNIPGDSPAERALFETYARRIREAAGGAAPRLLVEIHCKLEGDSAPKVIDVLAAGFSRDELEQLKRAFSALVEKHRPDVPLRLVVDATDPTYEYEGRTLQGRQDVTGVKTDGIFRKEFAGRGLFLGLPTAARTDDRLRAACEAILAEWLETVR